jgi:thiol-disulfide isomerase/thioredoxin
MKKTALFVFIPLILLSFTLVTFAQTVPARPAAGAQTKEGHKTTQAEQAPVYDESADAKADIAAAVTLAGKENRRVFVQWGANWCGWCRLLHKLFHDDKNIARKILYEYEVVLVDIGKFDKNTDLAETYDAFTNGFKKAGFPYLTVLDGDGRVVANQDTSVFEAGKAYDPNKVLEFLTKNQAEDLEAEGVLRKGLEKASVSGRRVFLHFGAPWCGWCKRLEAWMARPDVASLLAEDFVDVKIDQDRMTGGKEIKRRFPGSEKAGIPWFVVLDPDGKILVDSSFQGSNIGFPATEQEIAAFGEFLKKGTKTFSETEIQKLLDTLKQPPK